MNIIITESPLEVFSIWHKDLSVPYFGVMRKLSFEYQN